jgi:hypothetical protein
MSTQTKLTTIHLRQFGIIAGFLFSMFFMSITTSFAATTAMLYGTSDGNYAQWTPNAGVTHYTQVDETVCNGTTDYVSETTTTQRDSYGVSISSIPNGSTITQIQLVPCASRNSAGGGSATMNVFYRYNGVNSADAGAYAITGTTPVALATTSFSSLTLVKTATSTLEIGSVYTSGTKGARLSRLATVVTYTPPAPTVTTDTASSVSITTATLNGTTNPNSTSATGWFRYSTTNPGTCDDTFGTRAPVSGGDALGSGSSNVAYSEGVTGLSANTTYYYCAISSNTGGTSVGSVQNFTTQNYPVPTMTTNAASGLTTTTATLNALGNPNGATATGWFRYSTTNPGTCDDTFGTRAPVAGGDALGSGSSNVAYSENITGLTQNTTYYVCAIASNSGGTGVGSVQSFTTVAQPVPTVTTNTASSIAITTATLNALGNPNGATATGWFRYSTSNPGTCDDSFGTRAPVAGGDALGSGSSNVAFSENVTGLTQNTTYYVCAVASNSGGTGVGSVQSFTTLPSIPSAPTGVSASNVSGTENSISWTDTSSNESGFKVERSTNFGGYVQVGTTSANATSYSDTSATADNSYEYRVRSYNVSGNSSYSYSNYVITATVVPNAPTSLVATVGTSSPGDVFFSASHSGDNEDGFKLERSSDNVNFSVVATESRNNPYFYDSGLASGTYYYRIFAYNAVGNSGNSNTETVIIP